MMFQTLFKMSAFLPRREWNANCFSSGIQASMIQSTVNSLSRNSYSCGDCERRTQFSGSTAPLKSRTYSQISVLMKGYDSWSTSYWSSGNISRTLKPLPQSWDHRLVHVQNSRHPDYNIPTILPFSNMSSWRLWAIINPVWSEQCFLAHQLYEICLNSLYR